VRGSQPSPGTGAWSISTAGRSARGLDLALLASLHPRLRWVAAAGLLVGLLLATGCGFTSIQPSPVVPATTLDVDLVSARTAAQADPAAVPAYVDLALATSRLRCDAFFRAVALRESQRGFAQAGFNSAGGFAAGLMGLVGTASPVIAGTAMGAAFVNALFAERDQAVLPAVDLVALEDLVRRAELVSEQAILVTNRPTTYGAAERAVVDYDGLCSFYGLKRLVTESTMVATPVMAPLVTPLSLGAGRMGPPPSSRAEIR
jgi:hypothetical protein